MKKSDKLDIIYEDKYLLVVNKPAHLLTIATEDERINTLYHKAYEYLKKKNKNNKIFIVHRLDKDTSGIVVFAKSEEIKRKLQDDWNNLASVREYIAVVEGSISTPGTIKEYLTENKALITYATTKDKGKEAITHYEPIKYSKGQSVLKVTIDTGRKNQIRVGLANLKHPILGDKKYGSTKNPLRRLCLHASRLVLKNPITNQEHEFISKTPSEFKIFEI